MSDKNPCDGFNGCNSDGFMEMLAKMNNPRGFLKPGQKIGPADETLIRKGGLKAFFNPGTNELDFFYGMVVKNLLLVEDERGIRQEIIRGLEGTVFDVYAASTFEDALTIMKRIGIFDYAVIDDIFPEKRGVAPAQNANGLFDRIMKHSPDSKVFAYAERPNDVAFVPKPRDYRKVLFKRQTDVNGLCKELIVDAEKPEFYKVLIGDDNIEKLRARFCLDETLRGKRVYYACTPEATIELAKKKRYDIIVTDLQYTEGGCEGFDVLKSVRAPVKVLWTAAANSPDVRKIAADCGANYVFHKDETDKLIELLKGGLK